MCTKGTNLKSTIFAVNLANTLVNQYFFMQKQANKQKNPPYFNQSNEATQVSSCICSNQIPVCLTFLFLTVTPTIPYYYYQKLMKNFLYCSRMYCLLVLIAVTIPTCPLSGGMIPCVSWH